MGTILSTQELTHFRTGDNDYSNLILSWIIHQVPSVSSRDIKSVFSVSSKSEEDAIASAVKKMEKHKSLYVAGDKTVSKIRDLAFFEL